MDKYINKALKTLGIKWNDNQVFELKDIKDVDHFISIHEGKLLEIDILIAELKEAKDQVKKDLDLLSDLKHQIKVERYKDLNPDKIIL